MHKNQTITQKQLFRWIKDGCKNLIQKKYQVLQGKWGWIGMIWEKMQVTDRKTTSFAWKLLSNFELYFNKRIQHIKKDMHAQTVCLLLDRKILCMCKFQIVMTGVPWRHSQFLLYLISINPRFLSTAKKEAKNCVNNTKQDKKKKSR